MTGRRRSWRWAVAVWVILVAVAGGLTLWLRDAAEPPGPYLWQQASPTPTLPQGWESCPALTQDDDRPAPLLCVFTSR